MSDFFMIMIIDYRLEYNIQQLSIYFGIKKEYNPNNYWKIRKELYPMERIVSQILEIVKSKYAKELLG